MIVETPEHTTSESAPVAVPRSMSIGLGRKETAATRRRIDEANPVASLARALESFKGTDAWFLAPFLERSSCRSVCSEQNHAAPAARRHE